MDDLFFSDEISVQQSVNSTQGMARSLSELSVEAGGISINIFFSFLRYFR
jgi:hypothetical protein